MGYFDALTSSAFKQAEGGRKLFFPWGILGRGYVISSEQEYERLKRQMKAYTITALVLIIGSVALQQYLWLIITGSLLVAFYVGWTHYQLRTMQQTSERQSLQASMTSQALAHGAGGLWMLELTALAFVTLGVLMLINDVSRWPVAVGSIVFFGLCAVSFARMLVLRRRIQVVSRR